MAGPRRSRSNCIRGAFGILGSSSVKRRRRCAFFRTKFLDAYCSCSEDRSLYTDCGMDFTGSKYQKGIEPLLMPSVPEAVGLGDVSHLEDQLVLTPGNSVLPVRESHSDIYMEPENYFQTPMEIIDKEAAAFPSKSVELCELSQKSRTTAEPEWPRVPECPSPMEIEPSRSVGFLEKSVT
ncbi:hypothetical protein N336_12684, partial [Phalacrocorax carbo]